MKVFNIKEIYIWVGSTHWIKIKNYHQWYKKSRKIEITMSFFKKKDEFEISSYTYDLSFFQIVRFFYYVSHAPT